MGRRYYIPRTRSGSSMLASVLTQALDNQRKIRNYKLQQQLAKGQIKFCQYFLYKHPIFCVWVVSIVIALIATCIRG